MEFVNVRAEFLPAVHDFYFLVSVVSLAVAFLSFETVVIFAFLFAVGFLDIFYFGNTYLRTHNILHFLV